MGALGYGVAQLAGRRHWLKVFAAAAVAVTISACSAFPTQGEFGSRAVADRVSGLAFATSELEAFLILFNPTDKDETRRLRTLIDSSRARYFLAASDLATATASQVDAAITVATKAYTAAAAAHAYADLSSSATNRGLASQMAEKAGGELENVSRLTEEARNQLARARVGLHMALRSSYTPQ
jgi:hypothetical protein